MDLAYREAQVMNREAARMRLVETYMETGSIAETARRWRASRNVVRKWVERYRDDGVKGLGDRSRRPHRSPSRTQAQTEDGVAEAKKATGYGRKRLVLSPRAIRHILRRNGFTGRKTKRKTFYPAHWAWEEDGPFALAQVDVKDVLDKGALGTKLWDHLAKRKVPRRQRTFLEGRTRLRFLSWGHEITLTNGLCFMGLAMLWLRGRGIEGEVAWQTDWGEEFGGSNLELTRFRGQVSACTGGVRDAKDTTAVPAGVPACLLQAGGRWWSWCGQDGQRGSYPGSLSRPTRRSGVGSSKRTAMRAATPPG